MPNYSFDQRKDQTWEATEKSITIKSQQAIEENVVVATWQYANYHFAIIGENTVFDDSNKESSIPRTAIYIINNLTKID